MNTQAKATDFWDIVFNTPLESGMRSASLLLAAFPQSCDIQRLAQYDYLIVHSGDVEKGPPSIHPATPHRSGELLVRRALVVSGLEMMEQKSIVERRFAKDGLKFVAGAYAVVFLNSLQSTYARQLRERAQWVIDKFQNMSDSDLTEYMQSHWSQWGAEFVRTGLGNEEIEK